MDGGSGHEVGKESDRLSKDCRRGLKSASHRHRQTGERDWMTRLEGFTLTLNQKAEGEVSLRDTRREDVW